MNDAIAEGIKSLGDALAAPSAPVATDTVAFREGMSGSDVDWGNYEIDAEYLPLYARAKYSKGAWHYPFVMFKSVAGGYGDTDTGLAARLEEAVNKDGWRVQTILPNGASYGAAVLTQIHWTALPEPIAISEDNEALAASVAEATANLSRVNN